MTQELDIRPGDEVKEASHEQIVEQTARDIITQIRDWTGGKVFTAKKRWVFELIQNAVDTARARNNPVIKIDISYDDEILSFRHNGGYFTRNEIVAVIYGGSTKPYEVVSDYIGRFGTGFLVSHVVSRKVNIKGVLKTKDEYLCNVELNLNRENNKIEEISRNIEDCFAQLNNVVSMADSKTEHWTEFRYFDFDEQGTEAIRLGINELKENLPFVFAFNNIDEITINGTKYKKEVYRQEVNYTVVRVGSDYVYLSQDDDSIVSVGILIRDNKIISLDGRPKIFVAMPLTETADYIQVPFAINSTKFAPTKERDALSSDQRSSDEDIPSDYETNENILKVAFSLYFDLINALVQDESFSNLFNLLKFSLIAENRTAQNGLWYSLNELIEDTVEKITDEILLVDTLSGRKELQQTTFPTLGSDEIGDTESLFPQFYKLISQLMQNLPTKETVHVWTDLAKMLNDSFSNSNLTVYKPINLRDDLIRASEAVQPLPEFNKLQVKLNLETDRQVFLDFFHLANDLYKAGKVSTEFIENLLPDQNDQIGGRSGTWGRLHFEDPNEFVPNHLKNIAQKIGYNVRNELIANDFAKFEIIQKLINDTMSVEDVLDELLRDSSYQLPDRIETWDDEVVKGWIELFHWCILHKKLTGNFKVITKENKTQEIGDIGQYRFLVPFQKMGIEAEYENIYPDRRILHQKYFELEKQDLENFTKSLKTYKVFVTSLPVYEQEVNLDYSKLMSIADDDETISKVKHSVKSAASGISVLPLWNEVIGKIANDQTLGRLFFRFVLGYLIEHDNQWQQVITVSCQCTSEMHKIIPSRWLASVKTDSWIAVEKNEDGESTFVSREATKDNLENLFSTDADVALDELIQTDSDRIIQFLTHLGFDNLDLQIKQYAAKTGIPENQVRKGASQLIPLIGTLSEDEIRDIKELFDNNPSLFDEVLENAKEKLEDIQHGDDNRIIGENVEKIIKKIIHDHGLDVERIHVGGDLQIWPDKMEGWDSGILTIPPYTMEIKFTTGSRAHLSRAQSENARREQKNYFVLVVKNAGRLRERLRIKLGDDDITDELKNEIIHSSHVIEELHKKLGMLPNLSEIEPDIHGYWLKKQLWGRLENVQVWLDKILSPAET